MIEFLQPLFWLAGLAAAVPVLLHLMRRQQVRRIEFPAVRYLRRAEQRHARRLRLRHLLLLALRASLLLLLAATAAGPLIGRGGAADHRPTALAIVVDNSQSTSEVIRDLRLLDHFRERATETLALVQPEDRVAVFTATDPDRAAVGADADAAAEFLQGMAAVPARADLPGTLRRAREWLRSVADGRERELHLLTDLQRVSLESPDDPDPSSSGAAGGSGSEDLSAVALVPAPGSRPNGAPDDPAPEVLPLNAGEGTRISVPLRWFGPDTPDEPVVVRLRVGGQLIGAAEGRFGGAASLTLPARAPGWVQGHIEIDRHGLVADDRRYFTWFARPPPRVAVGGAPDEFLVRALDALERGGRLERVEAGAEEVRIAFAGEGVEDALAAGRSAVVVPAASALELPRLNARLERARIPWRYEPSGGTGSVRLRGSTPIEGLGELEIREFYRLIATAGTATDTALARLPDGEPWIVRGTTSDGAAYVLLATSLDPDASELPVSAAMVPFVDALIGDWARRGDIGATNREGIAPVRLPMRARRLQTDEEQLSVEPGSWLRPAVAGNYRVSDGDSLLAAFSVNAPIAESDLTPGDREALAALLPEADWRWVEIGEAGAWRAQIFQARRGRFTWRPLIALVLLFAIVETAVAASGRRKERERAAAIEPREPRKSQDVAGSKTP